MNIYLYLHRNSERFVFSCQCLDESVTKARKANSRMNSRFKQLYKLSHKMYKVVKTAHSSLCLHLIKTTNKILLN